MPASKVVSLSTMRHVRKVARYLELKRHPKHVGLELTIPNEYNLRPEPSFFKQFRAGVMALNSPPRPGRRTFCHAKWCMVTFPPGTHLSDKERLWFEKELVAAECYRVGVRANWHIDHKNGNCDLNLLECNFAGYFETPESRHVRDNSLWVTLKLAADRLTVALNDKRAAEGRPLILEMTKVVQNKLDRVAHSLANLGFPIRIANIQEALQSLGYQVTRFSLVSDYVTILNPESAEPSKCSKKRGSKKKRMRLSVLDLVNRAAYLRSRQVERDLEPER